MSNVSDTVDRILANVDGETKPESLSFEDRVEVLDLLSEELHRRAEHYRPTLDAMREDMDRAESEGMVGPMREHPVLETPADQDLGPDGGVHEEGGNGVESGPHGEPDVPVLAYTQGDTPSTKRKGGKISAAGSEAANDL